MLTSAIYARCLHLFTNLSSSEQFKRQQRIMWMSHLIGGLAKVEAVQNFYIDANIGKALQDKVHSLRSQALRDLYSDRQLCILAKLKKFIHSIDPKKAHKLSIKMVKRWEAEECEESKVQQQIVRNLMSDEEMSKWVKNSVETSAIYLPEKFKAILSEPGAKTRLLKLLGSKERYEELKNGMLKNMFPQNVFDSARLLTNLYFLVTLQPEMINNWPQKTCKLASDIVVFFQWLQIELSENYLEGLWGWIKDFVADQIYDPLFDMDISELDQAESSLNKIFIETKTFLENIKGKIVTRSPQIGEKYFRIWREIVTQHQLAKKDAAPRFVYTKFRLHQISPTPNFAYTKIRLLSQKTKFRLVANAICGFYMPF